MANYGRYYWCVKVPKAISKSGEIYLYADDVRVEPNGSLVFIGSLYGERYEQVDPKPRINLVLGPKAWISCYAASCFDGHAVSVEHWEGEIEVATTRRR